MITKLSVLVTEKTNPYDNIALEEYLLSQPAPGECILYLWQNRRTVVIGKNQNSWKECRIEKLEEEGGYLARRLSGGGAVFHDLGNLNFTFLTEKENYSLERQTDTILLAVRSMGIRAEKNGRNDMTVFGKKFSGNAFYESGRHCYHHGTLLLDVNMEDMSKYLTVSADKLKSKGVDSVRSRVANLAAYAPWISVKLMEDKLKEAFSQVYGIDWTPFSMDRIKEEKIRVLADKFSSWEWRYGRKLAFTNRGEERFPWGGVEIQLQVDRGRIMRTELFSDALEVELLESLKDALQGAAYGAASLAAAAEGLNARSGLQQRMKRDLTGFLLSLFRGV